MRSWTVLGVLSLLLLSTSFPIFIASAQEPTRSLGIDPLEYMTPEVLPTKTSDAMAYFETTVSVYDTVDEPGNVEFNVTNDLDWPISISPKSFKFSMPGSQKVNITVTVPAGTDASLVAVVKLFGYAAFPGENVTSSVAGYLTLKRVFSVSANYTYIKRSSLSTNIQINIVNTGNGQDTLWMMVVDKNKLEDDNIHVSMNHQTIHLRMNESVSFLIDCNYEGNQFPKNFDLKIQIQPYYGEQSPQVLVIPISFRGPDPPVQPNVFAGFIAAFVIVIVIILAVVLRGPAKKPK
jgi:hypothetical protein